MANGQDSACPINHKSPTWLSHTVSQEPSQNHPSTPKPQSQTWAQKLSSHLWTRRPSPDHDDKHNLATNRVVSSIPRSSSSSSTACPAEGIAPSNAEMETGVASSGNWVYPSEKMFFDAMRRKGYDARVVDMKSVVPIHNAVNERAWAQIRSWEEPYLDRSTCHGPMLESFSNRNDRMTPKARINTLLGYTAPFDRHDWVIDRCGTRVEYVIDFYAGRSDGKPGPSFYLDVRPKLNTWEGVKMRALKWTHLA
ncbi:cytochrome c1 heme lyase [Ophiocordyceps camponoti-floridani]|uniref:Holocytochrome c-type synthase n=1 Tax=Ophiocordyceps camponoti-floridani TaxID=2030778 RepID=A0A8H4VCQ2_9HYPO|nr:cytochrome c1 heme lyase [Ophiocordyceps camponoti-floridani]